MVMMYDNMRII